MMLIDTHAHLDSLEDAQGAINRAQENGIGRIVAVSSDIESSVITLEIGDKNASVFVAVGIHPHEASKFDESSIEQLEILAKNPKIVAIGETGLDYHYMNAPKEIQIESFRNQIRLAKKLKLPVVVHVRDAHNDVFNIIKDENAWETMGIIHCFTGDYETAKRYVDWGFYISFSGILTFKKAEEIRDAAKKLPMDRILVETDSPYLAPVPYRGKPNEPSYVRHVAEKLADIRGVSIERIEEETTINAKNLFLFENEEVPTSIAYKIRNSLYLNITNRCTIGCVFCGKWKSFMLRDYNLRLKKEPTAEEIINAAGGVKDIEEVVFVGWGESLLRLDVVKEVSKKLKAAGAKKVRIDTDGLANLVHGQNILPELKGVVDAISVSLNAHDADTYAEICPSKYGPKAYPAVVEFIKEAKKYIPDVTASVVTVPVVDVEACRKIVEDIGGVRFRPRQYGRVG